MKSDIIRTKEMRGHGDAEQLGAIKYIRTHAHSDSSELGLRLKTWQALVMYIWKELGLDAESRGSSD